MEKKEFEELYNLLETRVEACKNHLDAITDKDSLENLTVAQLKELKSFCNTEAIKQTNILMVDLYHIIGMANLTMPQLSKFTTLIKTYASYRPDIKAIAKVDLDIYNLPKVPKATRFKLMELGLTLTNQRVADSYEEDEETVDTYTNKKDLAVATLPVANEASSGSSKLYTFENNILKFNVNDAEAVARELTRIVTALGGTDARALAAAMVQVNTKYGITWTGPNAEGICLGVPQPAMTSAITKALGK